MSLLFYFKSPNAWIDVGEPIEDLMPDEVEYYKGRKYKGTKKDIKRIKRRKEEDLLLLLGEFDG